MNLEQFLNNITPNDLVLTSNRRLANHLVQQYDLLQASQHQTAWESVSILPLSTWVELTFNHQCDNQRIILNEFQELLLWEDIITSSPLGDTVSPDTAGLVKDTWNLLQHWQLDLNELRATFLYDIQIFISWCEIFEIKCQTMGVMSRAEILASLLPLLDHCKLPPRIFFLGFDDLTPTIRKLQTCLQTHSSVQNIELKNTVCQKMVRMSFSDHEEELTAMIRWACNELHHHPSSKIGCIVPNLKNDRELIDRLFQEMTAPDNYNISAANSLLDYPIIRHAMLILSLNSDEIDFEQFSILLRSPFVLGGDTESHARATLDSKLRQLVEHKISLHRFDFSLIKSCKLFSKQLQEFHTTSVSAPTNITSEQWASLFIKQLIIMGWPGERSLNSEEFQIVERFKKCFDEFITMQFEVTEMTVLSALKLFKRLLKNIEFQPQKKNAPIQILGMLEGVGINFDCLWVAGLTNENWPQPAAPNPFIPVALQKKYGMPHASSERELQFSINIMERLEHNASEIIFSYALHDGDRELAPSALIADYPEINFSLSFEKSIEQQLFETKKLEYLCDQRGPAITSELVSGGSGIFKAQAACPFQAFAKYRLRATPLPVLQIGLAATERGNLIHEVLAAVWTKIANHQSLCALSDHEGQIILIDAIERALKNLKKTKPLTISKKFIELEKQRLLEITTKWLNLEKTRQPFKVISCEERQAIEFGKIKIHIQIDRIDQLSNNSYVIIDYKTGRPSIQDWFTDRPQEPQLPLYSTVTSYPLSGVLFAQIRADEICFKGLGQYNDIAPGIHTLDRLKEYQFENWQALSDFWKMTLESLANDFTSGNAQIAPKNLGSCLYCDFHEICRINYLPTISDSNNE